MSAWSVSRPDPCSWNDAPVITLNRQAFAQLWGEKRLEIIPGATHLFEESGALEAMAQLARQWFLQYLLPTHADTTRQDTA
jgi:putative phosphoribosyl transferase